MPLNSVYVIPGYTFFYWGFTIPQRDYFSYRRFFRLRSGQLVRDVNLVIRGKRFPAKIRMVRIRNPKNAQRTVVQIFYDRERDTLKALRKLFIYSYASTINKSKPLLKELLELEHVSDGTFKVNVISKQKTDFDTMFNIMEDKNLFEYWRSIKEGEPDNFFIDFSRNWIGAVDLKKYDGRINVIYLLLNSKRRQLYVGKANQLGDRVKVGEGRMGLAPDWDKFMFFEVHPKYSPFLEQIEALLIRAYGALLVNRVGVTPLTLRNVRLVNRQLRRG